RRAPLGALLTAWCDRDLDRADVRRLRALLTLSRFELHLGTLGECLEALAGDAGVVHEQVLRPVLGGDEAVPLVVAEPLHGSSCHVFHLPQLPPGASAAPRSEEHTSELQSLAYLVCRLLLE